MIRDQRASSSRRSRESDRAKFLERLRSNRGYRRLQADYRYEPNRLSRLEEYCWLCYCQAIRLELKGLRARRLLGRLSRFEAELGDTCWPPGEVLEGLDRLRQSLEKLAAGKQQGQPRDIIGRQFRRNVEILLPWHLKVPARGGSLLREEVDDALSEIAAISFKRKVSAESYVRMRRRQKVEEAVA